MGEASFSKIIGEHSYVQDLKEANPNFAGEIYGWSQNCQRCVSTYEARRRGYDVTALPIMTTPEEDELSNVFSLGKGIFSPYAGANPKDMSANSGTQAELNIEELMQSWGDGARAIVCVQWKDEKGGGGHAFIAEQVNGKTRFVDPQTGQTNVKEYFDDAKGRGVVCGRIDNLPFTNRITECCRTVKRGAK